MGEMVTSCVKEDALDISQAPVNVLFSPTSAIKKDVWEINLVDVLNLLIKILESKEKKDLRVAGMAALSSSLIYRMKVESIFALHKAAMERKPLKQRSDVDIELIDMPYRHESTYPVSLDDLLGLLQNLIGSIANPRSRTIKSVVEPVEPPNFEDYFISLESILGKYEDLIVRKITDSGSGMLQDMVKDLDDIDSIRCFFAILFLARDEKIEIEQIQDDIKITLKEKLTS